MITPQVQKVQEKHGSTQTHRNPVCRWVEWSSEASACSLSVSDYRWHYCCVFVGTAESCGNTLYRQKRFVLDKNEQKTWTWTTSGWDHSAYYLGWGRQQTASQREMEVKGEREMSQGETMTSFSAAQVTHNNAAFPSVEDVLRSPQLQRATVSSPH